MKKDTKRTRYLLSFFATWRNWAEREHSINDPLSDDRNGWGLFTTDWGEQCTFTGVAYHLSLSKVGYIIVCTSGVMNTLKNSANFALQVQINIVRGNEGDVYFADGPIKGLQ